MGVPASQLYCQCKACSDAGISSKGDNKEQVVCHRADNDRIGQELTKLRQRAEQAERAADPLHRRIRDLTAQVESHNEEMRVVRVCLS